jgi:AcrR family transcriptional regulator
MMSGRQTCLNTYYLCSIMHAEPSVRDQILATASRLFLSQGYNQTGINQIIEEAGIAKASLYYNFPSKEDLGVAYLKERSEIWFRGLKAFDDPRKELIWVFEYRARFMEENNFAGCSSTRILNEMPQRGTKLHRQAVANKERQRKYFQDLVERIESIPEIKKKDVTSTVFLLFDGATLQCQIYQELWPVEEARRAVIDVLAQF